MGSCCSDLKNCCFKVNHHKKNFLIQGKTKDECLNNLKDDIHKMYPKDNITILEGKTLINGKQKYSNTLFKEINDKEDIVLLKSDYIEHDNF